MPIRHTRALGRIACTPLDAIGLRPFPAMLAPDYHARVFLHPKKGGFLQATTRATLPRASPWTATGSPSCLAPCLVLALPLRGFLEAIRARAREPPQKRHRRGPASGVFGRHHARGCEA